MLDNKIYSEQRTSRLIDSISKGSNKQCCSFQDCRAKFKLQSNLSNTIQRVLSAPVIFDYGIFKPNDDIDGKGILMDLEFIPNQSKANAEKIGLIQSVISKDSDGNPAVLEPRIDKRTVRNTTWYGKRKPEYGSHIDRLGEYHVPIYGADKTDSSGTLINDLTDTPTMLGSSTVGYCYRDATNNLQLQNARLVDHPQNHYEIEFETTALALKGVQKGAYYGSVSWGFKFDGLNVTPKYLKPVSNTNPSVNFMEAAKKWNSSKSGQTLRANKDVKVHELGSRSATIDLKNNDVITFVNNMTNGKMSILVGGSPIKYVIKVKDVKIDNDGLANIPIPIVHS